jgi:hypothetical protein
MNMRRNLLALACLLAATAALAANPYFLDRNGVLWNATSAPEGLVLTGTQNDVTVVRTVVPYALGLAGTSDSEIQVAADEVTGKVAVVWQRNWSADASEIMLAVWRDGQWERIEHLTADLAARPRNPSINLSEVSASVPNPDTPDDPGQNSVVRDSFLHVIWWEGTSQQHGGYALLRLTGTAYDSDDLVTQNLDRYAAIGLACDAPAPPEVLEHPLFAAQTPRDRALVLFGSERNCQFNLLQIRFVLDKSTTAPTNGGGITVIAQRRRNMPIFGVVKSFPMTRDLSMEGARIVLGADLNPVVYRVLGNTVEYVTSTDTGWSPRRTLTVRDGLTLDQAIPLVEGLAR